ncbi:hypothetical protein [Cellulomonas wangsupingiae]|uniref:hypothetical protein n=1 Tax=Cellulomonas wangsupingiae TaxID=2968085 RepID=UPI00202DF4F8|nr:hypothetical protein [Cellulomonas wangsupingiae]MCM0639997.1 hypothetical protein [Cellulomonas wangsupingiae]
MMDELLEDMIDPAPSRQDVARRRRAWATGSILVLAGVGVTSLTTSALFTDQDDLAGMVGTGTVVLGAQGAQFTMPAGGLAPGGTVLSALTVTNEGSLALRYAVSLQAAATTAPTPPPGAPGNGALHEQLRARVFAAVECTVAGTDAADPLGDTGGPAGDVVGLPTTRTPLVGDPETGQDLGDRVLSGETTLTETLCVRVDMPLAVGNAYQNTATTLTFWLDSEQTVNN